MGIEEIWRRLGWWVVDVESLVVVEGDLLCGLVRGSSGGFSFRGK